MKWFNHGPREAGRPENNDRIVIGAPIANPDFCESLEEARAHTLMTFEQNVRVEKRHLSAMKGLKRLLCTHSASAERMGRGVARTDVHRVDSELGYPA